MKAARLHFLIRSLARARWVAKTGAFPPSVVQAGGSVQCGGARCRGRRRRWRCVSGFEFFCCCECGSVSWIHVNACIECLAYPFVVSVGSIVLYFQSAVLVFNSFPCRFLRRIPSGERGWASVRFLLVPLYVLVWWVMNCFLWYVHVPSSFMIN